jgi:hypothetical protein
VVYYNQNKTRGSGGASKFAKRSDEPSAVASTENPPTRSKKLKKLLDKLKEKCYNKYRK